MSAFSRLRAFWFEPAPAERLAMFRLIVGAYGVVFLAVRFVHFLSYARFADHDFEPVGVASALGGPLPGPLWIAIVIATALLAPLFALGFRYRLVGPLFAALLLFVLTYSNSFGKILHTDNLFCLHVIVLAAGPAADALSLDARAGRTKEGDLARYGWPLRLACAACALAYFLAGYAKLKNSGLDFLHDETLRNYVAFDNVRKIELGSTHSPLGALLLPVPYLFGGLAALSLVLELGAPFAIAHRRIAAAWAVCVWGFHFGVLALMMIAFMYQLSGVAFASFFALEKLLDTRHGKKLRAALSPSRATPAAA